MIYQFGDCTFDTTRGEVRRSDNVTNPVPQVLSVLRYLLEHRDRVVSRDELLEQCWPESYVSDGALTSCLRRVRQTIGQSRTGPTLIETLHRRGYRFVGEVTEVTELVETAPRVTTEIEVEAPPLVEPRLPQAVSPERSQTDNPPAPSPVLTPDPVGATERRHLTVLSCTLSDSESLTQQLDPEDYYELMQTFHATLLAVVTPYDAYVAKQLDDGVILYFGYPQAHEDDAQRAVHSGLALISALGQIAPAGLVGAQAGLAVRVGIDTGMVIVSSGAGIAAQPALAVGSPPTEAVRLGELARSAAVIISEATAQLVSGYFDCKALSDPTLERLPESQVAYEVLSESALQTRLDVGMIRGLTPFVGRETELALLHERWDHVQEGMGQVVVLRGEAGIGKSRLIQALKTQVVDEQAQTLECRCSSYYQHTALYPVIDLMNRLLQAQLSASGTDKLERLEALLQPYPFLLHESVPLLASLLSLSLPAECYPPLNLPPTRQREQTLELLSALVAPQVAEASMVFIVEDLHWADPSTLDFLELLIRQMPTRPILVVMTCRPSFEAPWTEPTWMTSVTLNRLTRPQIDHMITQVTGGRGFSAAVTEQLTEKADGVPLFVEELTRTVLETGQFKATDERYELVGELADLSIPATLHDSLMSRLDRLGAAKEIAQWGAVLGREFTNEVLQMVTPHDEVGLRAGLDRLVESELVFQRGVAPHAHYRFKHALVQDVAYQSLGRRMRQDCHQQIAKVLAEQFPETAEVEPELVAHHYTEAGCAEVAVAYWQRAGERAGERSAHQEAISHLTTGLSLLQTLPESQARHQQELSLQTALGTASLIVRGHADPGVEAAYTRARVLCQKLGDTQDMFPVLFGLWRFYNTRSDFPLARQLGEELLGLAEQSDEVPLYVVAHYALGWTRCNLGEFIQAHRHFEESIEHYTPSQRSSALFRAGQDPGISCLVFRALTLWLLGYPDQALSSVHDALSLASDLVHSFSEVFALNFASIVWQFRREGQDVYDHAETAVTLATEQGFTQMLAFGTILQSWVLTAQGQGEEGLTQMCQGFRNYRASGSELLIPYFLILLAEGYGNLKQVEEGLGALNEGLEVMERTGEHWWQAEGYRLKGELLLLMGIPNIVQAEMCFHQALEVSRNQKAKSLELRAATSLAKLWQSQNKLQEAYNLLTPVYDWFTEGFNTVDLMDAKALLAELSKGR